MRKKCFVCSNPRLDKKRKQKLLDPMGFEAGIFEIAYRTAAYSAHPWELLMRQLVTRALSHSYAIKMTHSLPSKELFDKPELIGEELFLMK